MAINKISVILIKANTAIEDIIKDGCSSEKIKSDIFYYKPSFQRQPKWVNSFFNNTLQDKDHLRTSSVQGALLINRNYEGMIRYFAICFGYGRNIINLNAIEERFGLITTLNSVDAENLRSIDINSLEAIPKTNRIQSSKLSGIPNFNIDIEKDLLKAVAGKCTIEPLGKNISGADPLCISTQVDIDSIGDVLDIAYSQYKRETYKEHFDWIDHIAVIKSSEIINQLDAILLEKLNALELDKIWMAVPDVVDWDVIHKLKLSSRGSACDDIDIKSVLTEVYENTIDNIEQLKRKYVKAYNADGSEINKWTYHKCLYAEIELANEQYIINNGKWYRINTDFVQMINDFYTSAAISDIQLPNYSHLNEGEYNEAASNTSEMFFCMDKKLISTGVSKNNIEFCDIYTSGKQMIHIKRHGGSSVLSHLFNQGLVSANLFITKQFRVKLNEKLEIGWIVPTDTKIKIDEYEVVFGIISKINEERPSIPFFSKITFKNIASTLSNFGYKVSLKRISDNTQNV
ncbi:MAG: TIGR04141 family sporadically distributed protein [Akkermansia sp.]